MKGYKKPEEIMRGICFICKKPCDEDAYCHFDCAISLSEERNRKIEEARKNSPVNQK